MNVINKNIIFISGRFRSGTSMLWNLFENHPQYHAWYEPLHPNLIRHIEYTKPKDDHIGVTDYWKNYRVLKNLDKHFLPEFGSKRLFLQKHDSWEELKNYIYYLISNSGEKTPVIQFNRMDLRLSWLKNTFPNSIIINIQREAYPLWISSRKHITNEKHKNDESYPDAYELMQWSVELAQTFPMLQKQPNRSSYFRHYFIWKLSQQMAESCANLKLSLESDFFNSKKGINKIAELLGWSQDAIEKAAQLLHKPESIRSSENYEANISEIETKVDKIFRNSGLRKYFPSTLISNIKHEFKNEWDKYNNDCSQSIQELLGAINYQNDELTRLLNQQTVS